MTKIVLVAAALLGIPATALAAGAACCAAGLACCTAGCPLCRARARTYGMDARTRREVTELTARLADGDREAFDPLFDALWPFLRAFATRLLGDPADADDAAQQALLRVFARASEYEAGRDALPWIVAIAANECRTLRNRRSRRREESLGAADPAAPADDGEAAAIAAAALALLGELPAEDLATLRAAWFGDPRPDIAAATFRKRVQRSTRRLRELWRTRHGSP